MPGWRTLYSYNTRLAPHSPRPSLLAPVPVRRDWGEKGGRQRHSVCSKTRRRPRHKTGAASIRNHHAKHVGAISIVKIRPSDFDWAMATRSVNVDRVLARPHGRAIWNRSVVVSPAIHCRTNMAHCFRKFRKACSEPHSRGAMRDRFLGK